MVQRDDARLLKGCSVEPPASPRYAHRQDHAMLIETALSQRGVAALLVVVSVAAPSVVRAQPTQDFVPVTDAMLLDPSPNDWPM